MKKISVLIALGMLMIAPWGMAQTIYDGAKLTGKDLNGTARFVGMGGAMGALGGDISTMGTNPAGIGLYRSSDVMTSFGFSLYGNESQYLGKKFNSDLTKGDFNNIGFVFSSKIGNETPLRFVNFGFNYHKAKSFNNNMRMEGNLGLYSQTYLMASQAAGIEKWGDSPYTDNGIGWLSILLVLLKKGRFLFNSIRVNNEAVNIFARILHRLNGALFYGELYRLFLV